MTIFLLYLNYYLYRFLHIYPFFTVIIIRNKILPIGHAFIAINIFGILFTKGDCSEEIIRHERIHTAQMKELLYIPFYLLYFCEWIFCLIKYRNALKAYYAISFEREAYQHQSDPEYLTSRPRYANFRKKM